MLKKVSPYVFTVILFSSCAKVRYIAEQSWGQIKLESSGRSNEKVLQDQAVSIENKKKIKLIMKAKTFFYDYFGFNSTSIYNQTTMLESEAVSYLVIHSKQSEIKAQRTSIPFIGDFPYLGFFKKNSAMSYKERLEGESFHTYMRPVYAYSTLNHPLLPFDDNILSSFFYYPDDELTHLIFHELVHTVVFVKNNVRFNENFAEFIASKLMQKFNQKYINYQSEKTQKQKKGQELSSYIVDAAKRLNLRYKKAKNYKAELRDFLREEFLPGIKVKCRELELSRCWPLKGEWNNARFAAFNTYSAKRDVLNDIYTNKKLNLKEFLLFVKEKEQSYNGKEKFIEYLK